MLRQTSRFIQKHVQSVVRSGLRFNSSVAADTMTLNPHFDYKFVLNNIELYRESMRLRNYTNVDLDLVQDMVKQREHLLRVVFLYRAYRNNIATRMKQLNSKKPELGHGEFRVSGEIEGELDLNEASILDLVHEGKRIKSMINVVENQLEETESVLDRSVGKLPNLTHPDVPVGDESYATILHHPNAGKAVLETFSSRGFVPLDHTELCQRHNQVDFENASKVTGSRFYYLQREAALLELALVNYAMAKLVMRGFIPVTTPDQVKTAVVEGAGFQSKDEKTLDHHIFSVANTDLSLSATAEIPMAGKFINEVMKESDLPIKTVAFSHCFRTEAGRGGVQVKGLYRVHQFSKVEMFVVCTPEQAQGLHDELVAIEKELFTDLGLNFRVLDMPTLDLGAPAYRKIDMEACMPGRAVSLYKAAQATKNVGESNTQAIQKEMDILVKDVEDLKYVDDAYGEISSASNCTDYQSRRQNIRYKPVEDAEGKATRFAYTLNGTACAVPRMIVALLEQNQREDGTIEIPLALQPYMLNQTQIPFPNRPF